MMMERRFFKTKLCKLYQGGRCPRQNCSFAHGNSELRNAPALFNARRDDRGSDLRERIDRRYSPHRRYSPGRDERGHHAFRNQKPVSHDRGYSESRSPVKTRERRHRKKQHLDGESDDPGSHKISIGGEEKKKEDKVSSYDENYVIKEEIKQTQLEIEYLDDQKAGLEISLEEKFDEAHKLSKIIEDFQMQLNKEQEDCRRTTAKIKNFLRVHGRYIKAQEELKRSQARLQMVGDQLGSDTPKASINEEDSSVNIASDGEHEEKLRSPKKDELQSNALIKKRIHVHTSNGEEAQIGNSQKRKRFSGMIIRSEKPTKVEGPLPPSENENKEIEAKKAINIKKDVQKSLLDEYKHKRGKNSSAAVGSLDKVKGSEAGRPLPSTSMAAQAVDELIEATEMEKSEALEVNAPNETDAAVSKLGLSYIPPPPPPSVVKNAYKQYEADDEDVDVEKVDDELLDIDLNSELDI